MKIGLVVALVLVSLFSAMTWAQNQTTMDDDFYSEKAKGWFWYEQEPDLAPEEEETKPPPPAPVVPAAPSPESKQTGPSFGSAAWIRDAMPKLLEKATDDPTKDNVAAYYYVQRLMKDKSEKFADVSQEVVLADPWLDENTRRPIAQFGSDAMDRISDNAKEETIRQVASMAGIWFFYKGGCQFCLLQAPVLKGLQRQYGFNVMAVSMDGSALSNGAYPDFMVDHGQSIKIEEQLGVDMTFTPSLFLVKPGKNVQILPITFGLTSASEITGRILMQAAAQGWIDRATYDSTRKMRKDLNMADIKIGKQNYSGNEDASFDSKNILNILQKQAKEIDHETEQKSSSGQ